MPPRLTTAETLPTLRSETMAAYGHLPTLHFDSRDIKDVDDHLLLATSAHSCTHAFSPTPLHTSPSWPLRPISHCNTQYLSVFSKFCPFEFRSVDGLRY